MLVLEGTFRMPSLAIEVARDIIRAGFQSARQLSELLPTLRERCPPEVYTEYSRAIGAAVHSIMSNTIDKAISDHPTLRAEIDEKIARDGRYT